MDFFNKTKKQLSFSEEFSDINAVFTTALGKLKSLTIKVKDSIESNNLSIGILQAQNLENNTLLEKIEKESNQIEKLIV